MSEILGKQSEWSLQMHEKRSEKLCEGDKEWNLKRDRKWDKEEDMVKERERITVRDTHQEKKKSCSHLKKMK